MEKYEKYELHITGEEEMKKERERLWKEGWAVSTGCDSFYDIGGNIKVYVLKAVKYTKKKEEG